MKTWKKGPCNLIRRSLSISFIMYYFLKWDIPDGKAKATVSVNVTLWSPFVLSNFFSVTTIFVITARRQIHFLRYEKNAENVPQKLKTSISKRASDRQCMAQNDLSTEPFDSANVNALDSPINKWILLLKFTDVRIPQLCSVRGSKSLTSALLEFKKASPDFFHTTTKAPVRLFLTSASDTMRAMRE